jgi:hypothetical protein
MSSNFHPNDFGANIRTRGSEANICVRIFAQFTTTLLLLVNALKVRQNRPQGSNVAFKVRLRADGQLPNELVFEYT